VSTKTRPDDVDIAIAIHDVYDLFMYWLIDWLIVPYNVTFIFTL
jgi:hypothetical protein